MALTLTAGTSVEGTASATSTVVTLPAGLVDGDYTIIFVSNNATNSTITTPAGWTDILADTNSANGSTSMSHAIFYRKWVSGDGNVTVTHSNGRAAATPVKVSGADPGTFVNTAASVTQAASNAQTLVAPTITPSSAHLFCVFTGRRSANGAFLTPFSNLSAGMTQVAEANGKATSQTNAGHLIAYEEVTPDAATGTRQADAAGTTTGAFGVSFAINEATGGPVVINTTLETFESGTGIWTPTSAGSGTATNSAADTHQSILGIGANVPSTTVDKAGFSYNISPGVQQVSIEGWWRVSAEGIVDSNVPFCRFDWGTTRVADVYRQNQIASGFNLWLRVTKADGIGSWYIPFGLRLELNQWVYMKVVWGTNGIPHVWVDGVQYLDASDAPADYLVTTTINNVWLGSPEAGNQGTWSMDNVTLTTMSSPITPLPANGAYGQFSGSGTLAGAQDDVDVTSSGALSGSGTLSASVSPAFTRAASLSGSGTLSSTRVVGFAKSGSLSGSGTLTATASKHVAVTANLSGSGTLTSTRSVGFTKTGTLSGTGTLTGVGVPNVSVAVGLSGSGILSATAEASQQATAEANFSGSGTLSSTRSVGFSKTGSLSGSGTLSATASKHVAISSNLSGSGTLSASGTKHVAITQGLSGSGTLSVSPTPGVSSAATLSGSGTLSATANASELGEASVSLSGSGTLSATVKPAFTRSVSLSGSGTLSGTSGSGKTASGYLSSTGTLSASVSSQIKATGTLSGGGTLSAVAIVEGPVIAAFSGAGVLTATAHNETEAYVVIGPLGPQRYNADLVARIAQWDADLPRRWNADLGES